MGPVALYFGLLHNKEINAVEQEQPASMGTENEIPPEQPALPKPHPSRVNIVLGCLPAPIIVYVVFYSALLLIPNPNGSEAATFCIFGSGLAIVALAIGGFSGEAAGRWAYARFHNHLTAALVALFAGCASGILLVWFLIELMDLPLPRLHQLVWPF